MHNTDAHRDQSITLQLSWEHTLFPAPISPFDQIIRATQKNIEHHEIKK